MIPKKCSGDNSVGVATGYRLDGPSSIPVGAIFSFLHRAQIDSEVNPVSYPVGTGGSFPGSKASGT
jgi:hypothetical protein